MSPVSTRSRDKLYRYYTCGRASKSGHGSCPVRSVPAEDIEQAVIQQLREIFKSPEMVTQAYQFGEEELDARTVSEQDVAECLRSIDPIWDDLFPLEQSRIVEMLVERATVNPHGMDMRIRGHGLHSLVTEIRDTTSRHEGSSAI